MLQSTNATGAGNKTTSPTGKGRFQLPISEKNTDCNKKQREKKTVKSESRRDRRQGAVEEDVSVLGGGGEKKKPELAKKGWV